MSAYSTAIYIRIFGIVLSIVALSFVFIKPLDYIANTIFVYAMLIAAALFIMLGDLIVIKSAPDEEFSNRKQRREAIYDVISTAIVMAIFTGVYVIPFLAKHVW